MLIEPEIPWNTGNAGRTCLAAGAQLHLGASVERVRRATSGHVVEFDYWWRDGATRAPISGRTRGSGCSNTTRISIVAF